MEIKKYYYYMDAIMKINENNSITKITVKR